MTNIRPLPLAAGLILMAALAGCSTAPAPRADAPRIDCASLTGTAIGAARMGLPSGDARIDAAENVAASGVGTAAMPAFCKVLGRIAPRDAAAQAIQFQVNLPVAWNGKALQYGGGGYNGVLVTGLTPLRDAGPTDALPIARGYLTFGTDSGHQAASFPASEPGAFTLNDEMLENFAFASYKKVRDVAVELARLHYGRAPQRVYYFGGSEGGREGLTMAQRFPHDYDGIVSVVPVVNWTGLFHAFVRNQLPQFNDWLDATKTPRIARAVAEACDALDGLADGVVNHYLACQRRVNLSALRCPDGNDTGVQCLSDAELGTLGAIHSGYTFSFPLANGVTRYPAWWWGHEDSLDGPTALNLVRWVTGTAPPSVPPQPATAATQWLYGSNWIRYAIARDAAFDVRGYRPESFAARVQQTSALMDSTNPDLSAFFARGGKIIVRENGADRAQSPQMGIDYVQSVIDRLGAAAVERSLRLYVSPASTHSGNGRSVTTGAPVPTMVDLLDPLDAWVTQGRAPADALVQTAHGPAPGFGRLAERPMCRYPAYPHYMGGDVVRAASYACRAGRP